MIYFGTGATCAAEDGTCETNDFWQYNTSTGVWTQKAAFAGAARNEAVAFSIGNYGYIGTGRNNTNPNGTRYNDLWQYNPTSNSWTQKANFPGTARADAVGFSVGNKGYIGTGRDISNNYYRDFYAYDPGTNVWSRKADYGGAATRGYAFGFSIGSYGYLGCGNSIIDGTTYYYNDFWQYDTLNNVWNQKADFGGPPRYSTFGFSISSANRGFAGMGSQGSTYYKDWWVYDPIDDNWTQAANYTGGGGAGIDGGTGTGAGSYIYYGTGWTGTALTNDWNKFDPCNHAVQTSTPPPICSGSSVVMSCYQLGGSNTSYTWSNGASTAQITISPTVTTSYTVTITTNSLPCIGTINVTVNPSPTVTAGGGGTICSGKSSVVSVSGNANSILYLEQQLR